MKQFEGKTAVVTGAASGIGRALAERFAQARMQVVLADIEKDALDRAVQELEQRQHRVIGVVANTMVRESVEALAKRAIEEFGKVHVVCNNAGIAAMASGMKPIWEVSDRDWQWVMGVNFYGVLYGIQAFVPHMLAHGEEGHIVNTASLAGLMPGGGTYGVSKHGVLSLTETLHQNLTMQGAKIGASVLCPGFVNTNIFDAERNRPKDLATKAAGDIRHDGRDRAQHARRRQTARRSRRHRVPFHRTEPFLHPASPGMGSHRARKSRRGAVARSADDPEHGRHDAAPCRGRAVLT